MDQGPDRSRRTHRADHLAEGGGVHARRGSGRPTMLDVAASAGVSLKTVSRVVNDEPGVSAAVADRVRRAVEELNFRPHGAARSLRRADGKTSSIALLLDDVANPYSSTLQRTVEDVARPQGVTVFSASLDEDPIRERELTRTFAARRPDGMILMPVSDDQSYLEADLRAGMAIVCVDRPARNLAVDSIVTTNFSGASEAVRHLGTHGHRRIAYLGDRQSIPTSEGRFNGYCEALAMLGLTLDPDLVRHDISDPASADGAVSVLLGSPAPPTALFTAQNLVTLGAIRALRRLGVERQVALVGFDDFPLADLLQPPVTVVAQDVVAIGRLAAGVLFARLGGDLSPPREHLLPTTLIRRGSGEIPAR